MESESPRIDIQLRRVLWAIFRVLRIALFLFGIFSSFWFFYSFIGITVGLLYFVLHRDTNWKRHGLALAFIASISDVISHRTAILPPLRMAMVVTLTLSFVYAISSIAHKYWPERWSNPKLSFSRINSVIASLSRRVKAVIVLLMVLSPILLWSGVNIDFGVMFDNEPRLLWVHAPSTVVSGSEFNITVEAWDAYERLSAIYKGTVAFSIESYNYTTCVAISSSVTTLPDEYTFTGQTFGSDIAYEIRDGNDNGLHVFQARINTPGIHYILVDDSETENTYYSNPIIVRDLAYIGPNIYWGDIHTHSGLSDGTGSAEHSFYYARHIACLDYYALTDHGEIMLFGLGSLDKVESVANDEYEPNRFVTFQGIEWTNDDTGHYTCIFSGDQLIKTPVVSYLTLPTADDLWNTLDEFTDATGSRALALPHHTTQGSYIQDWTYVNPKYVKIAEVTSVHGECLFEQRHPLNYVGCILPPPEYLNGSSIIDAFKMGLRMTLYASSDEHDGHPGHSLSHSNAFIGHQRPWTVWHTRNEHPYPGGLVAVYAHNLTRDSIFSGLERQFVFASSDHGRSYLDFTINGTKVGDGSTFTLNSTNATREIRVVLAQDGAPAARKRPHAASVTPNWTPNWNSFIEIIKNGEMLARIQVSSPVAIITYIDSEPVTGTSYGQESCVWRDGHWYINSYSDNPIDPSTLNTGSVDFYIIRVVSENGRMTYEGPIWVEVVP